MTTYTYKARDQAGKAVEGTMEAPTTAELAEKLHKMGYLVTRVERPSRGWSFPFSLALLGGVSTEDFVVFNVQLANLIHAGISILSSLHTLSQQIENKKLKGVVGDVSRNVEAGESFSEALARHPEVFPVLFVSMVKAGEASGKLDQILTRYATYCEEQAELRQKIQGALLYPAVLLLAGTAVMLFVVSFLIPQFATIFMKAGIELPLVTQALYHVGMGIRQFWHTILILGLLGWVGFNFYASRPWGRRQVDALKLRLPLLGSIFRKAAIARFSRTLGMLVQAGVPILESLAISREVVGNEVMAQVIETSRKAVEKGDHLSEPLRASGEFPPDTLQMITVGEETGRLDEMLGKIAEFYDRSVGYSVRKLTTLIEPLLLILMGGLVGLIMASMLLPMFDMMKFLRHARPGF